MVVKGGLTNIWEKKISKKGKGEEERYTYLNAEFQRIAWRDKNAFLNEQCKEIEGNNRMLRDDKYLFLSLLEAGKSKALANSVRIWWEPPSWFVDGHLLAVASHGDRGKGALQSCFCSDTNCICENSAFMTYHFPKTFHPHLLFHMLGIRI